MSEVEDFREEWDEQFDEWEEMKQEHISNLEYIWEKYGLRKVVEKKQKVADGYPDVDQIQTDIIEKIKDRCVEKSTKKREGIDKLVTIRDGTVYIYGKSREINHRTINIWPEGSDYLEAMLDYIGVDEDVADDINELFRILHRKSNIIDKVSIEDEIDGNKVTVSFNNSIREVTVKDETLDTEKNIYLPQDNDGGFSEDTWKPYGNSLEPVIRFREQIIKLFNELEDELDEFTEEIEEKQDEVMDELEA